MSLQVHLNQFRFLFGLAQKESAYDYEQILHVITQMWQDLEQ
jgi:hypothetical protein